MVTTNPTGRQSKEGGREKRDIHIDPEQGAEGQKTEMNLNSESECHLHNVA